MDLTMANSVQKLSVSAAFGLGYQVVGIALADWNPAFAQRTDQFAGSD
jgi:hypothetical protein